MESQAIAEKLQLLQSTGPKPLITLPTTQQSERATLPPNLIPNAKSCGVITENNHQIHGLATPSNNALGLAEPFNPAQASSAPPKTAPTGGAPRLEEAG